MSDADAIDLFVRSTIGQARALPICEARPFLHGLLLLGEDRPELGPVIQLHSQLCQVDDQLELIASGQLKLEFAAAAPPPFTAPARREAGSPDTFRHDPS